MASLEKRADARAVLGLSEKASAVEVIAAHRRLAFENHPDREPDPVLRPAAEERLKSINAARDTLGEPIKSARETAVPCAKKVAPSPKIMDSVPQAVRPVWSIWTWRIVFALLACAGVAFLLKSTFREPLPLPQGYRDPFRIPVTR